MKITIKKWVYLRKKSRFSGILFLFILLNLLQSLPVSAQQITSDSLVKVQIVTIQNMLDLGKRNASLWWNGWLYGYSAATAVQGAIYFTNDIVKTRQDMALGAATTLVGAVGQLIMPMVPVYAPKRLALIPGETPEERIQKLAKAEELFKASAKREQEGRSWKMHAASGVVNLSSGLVTWLGFKRTFWAGFGNFLINSAITEAQIWSQPTRAIKDYQKYCEKYKNGLTYHPERQQAQWFVSAYPGGLTLRIVF